jgi:hypothetical protein
MRFIIVGRDQRNRLLHIQSFSYCALQHTDTHIMICTWTVPLDLERVRARSDITRDLTTHQTNLTVSKHVDE